MIAFGVTIDDAKFQRAMGRFKTEFDRATVLAVRRYMERFRARMSKERLRSPVLNRRTGNLQRSQKVIVEGRTVDDVVGLYAIGGGLVRYARIHEYGGTVRAASGKYLAIPIDKTRAGVARRPSPRDYPNTFIRKGIIWQKIDAPAGKGARRFRGLSTDLQSRSLIKPLFVLKKQVYIPPRLGMRETWAGEHQYRIDFFKAVFDEAFRRAELK